MSYTGLIYIDYEKDIKLYLVISIVWNYEFLYYKVYNFPARGLPYNLISRRNHVYK